MTISVAGAISQNTAGLSEGLPQGVPVDYSWYNGMNRGTDTPPANFTSVGGWGQIYLEKGSTYSNPNATVDLANAQTWVHLKATNQWVQVQTQASDPIEGGHFVADFAGNAGMGMTVIRKADGTTTMPVPPSGYNDHFWHIDRGQFAPGTVDGVYTQMDMKISDPNVKAVANLGADWWTTPTANYVDGFANNPGAGMSNWVELTGEYKTLAFFSGSAAEFQANPPPPCLGAVTTEPKPPVTSDPTTPPITATPVPTEPTTDPTTAPTTGVNLLKNGSFETTQLGSGKVGIYGQVEGWTAQSGSKVELWNNVSGVKATNGTNFSELDYHTDRDGFSQSVTTTKGQTYTFSIDARVRPGVNPNSCGVEVVWNGNVVSTIPPGADWKSFSVDVTGSGGSDTLTLREPANQSFDGVGALVDNLRLVAKTPSTTGGATTLPPTTPPVTATPVPTEPTTNPTTGVNLLKNGSFEATQLGTGKVGIYGQVEGWTAQSGSKVELWNNVSGVKATNGTNFSELDYHTDRDGFSQSVTTTKGQTYTFSIDARVRPGVNPNSCGVEVVWNGNVVSTIPPGADWKSFSVDVTGSGGSDTLTLREPANQSFDGVGALVDNLRLVAKTPSATGGASTSIATTTALSADASVANASLSSGGGATNPAAAAAIALGSDATTPAPASTTSQRAHAFESGTLGFRADASTPAFGRSEAHADALPLFRQQLAAAFVDFGAATGSTPIHDHAAVTLGQTLTPPRHA